ncbi:MAG: beta-ketoacyl synthase chain length factor [Gammaproteobacteria bacterium]
MHQTTWEAGPACTGYFGIARWQAWAPGVDSPGDWRTWLNGGTAPNPETQADVGQLPALLRRRLDRLGRMAMHTAWSCVDGLDAVQIVFASRHGALRRTLEMLTALAYSEPLSPTVFSLAVHNSPAGLYSIARKDRSAATALAAGPDTLSMALLEGAGMIAAGSSRVLVCYADDLLPPFYQPYVEPQPTRAPFSISLLLTSAAESPLRCRLAQTTGTAPEAPEAALLRFFVENAAEAMIGADQPWRLERSPSAG